MRQKHVYTGEHLAEISFPLGGIGTGSLGLAGNGRLVDWEIFNKPAKGSVHGFSHFAVRAESGGRVVDARVLHGDLPPPYTGVHQGSAYATFGFGPPREYLTGLPHFREVSFDGRFPAAHLTFREKSFPGVVELTALNPFIPLNTRDSSIPAAFFEIRLANTTRTPLTYTVCSALKNPFPPSRALNRFQKRDGASLIKLSTAGMDPSALEYGDLTVATDAGAVSYQEYWYRGSWFDNLSVYWRDFTTPGPFKNRRYDGDPGADTIAYGKEDMAGLAVRLEVRPGDTGVARFVIAWSFPNVTNYWNPPKQEEGEGCCPGGGCASSRWRNYYAGLFPDSTESATYSLANWDRLVGQTMLFRDALFDSTLPPEVLDAVSANISILKSPTVLRLEDGTFYGFEGCHPASGCCEGSCTHVWNYAYALPFLFPELERSMREADLRYNLGADGGMAFRLQLPLGRRRSTFRPCADGQFGGVIKCYREWRISGDTSWLRRHWPAIRSSIEYAWSISNEDGWDRDRDGVLEGRQHHTLDMELFGPNSWLTGMYLAALAAGAEMAEHLGETDTAETYRGLLGRGRAWVDEHLFNGEYYHQLVDLGDRKILEAYEGNGGTALGGTRSTVAAYWSEEHGEIKYQVAQGCGVDQVLGQWHANLVGLGRVFDEKQTRKALRSIYRYNFKRGLRSHANPCRVYALNDEEAVVICSFPKGAPAIPVPYAEEAMNGFEYQVACHMIQEGLVDEGLEIVKAVRDRYDGRNRNPWNEIECGSNYARSMASYSLLLALSGFSFDLRSGHLGFRPVVGAAKFRCLWSIEGAWGTYRRGPAVERLTVLAGSLTLSSFSSELVTTRGTKTVTVGGKGVAFTAQKGMLRLEAATRVEPGHDLVVKHRAKS